MFGKEELKELQEKVAELSEKLDRLSDKQNSQFTDLMLQLKETKDDIRAEIAESKEKTAIFYEGDGEGVEDSMYEPAKEAVINAGQASTSYIQRKLGIGYSRASNIMATLEEEGVIGPATSSKPRKVLTKQ